VFTGAKVKVFESPRRRRDVQVSLVNFYYKGGEYKCCTAKGTKGKKITKLKDGKISIDWKKLKHLPKHALECISGVKTSFQQEQSSGEGDDENEDDRSAVETMSNFVQGVGSSCRLAAKDIKDAVSIKKSEYDGVRAVVDIRNDGQQSTWSDESGRVPQDGHVTTSCPAAEQCAAIAQE
jgi:hypothetical protein